MKCVNQSWRSCRGPEGSRFRECHVLVFDRLRAVGRIAVGRFADQKIDVAEELDELLRRPRVGDEAERDSRPRWTKHFARAAPCGRVLDGLAALQELPQRDRQSECLGSIGLKCWSARQRQPIAQARDVVIGRASRHLQCPDRQCFALIASQFAIRTGYGRCGAMTRRFSTTR